jgi:acetyl-CoA acetyltransferase
VSDVVIVEAVRTPVGRRNGGLSGVHPAELLGLVQRAASSARWSTPGLSVRSSVAASRSTRSKG